MNSENVYNLETIRFCHSSPVDLWVGLRLVHCYNDANIYITLTGWHGPTSALFREKFK